MFGVHHSGELPAEGSHVQLQDGQRTNEIKLKLEKTDITIKRIRFTGSSDCLIGTKDLSIQ
jgi:hypothetical protein